MEPKPLSSECYDHVLGTLFDASAVQTRADLASFPMAVIGLWSSIDCHMASLLSSILRTPDLSVVMAMYQSLPSAGSRRTALVGAIGEALSTSPDDLNLFNAVQKAIRPSQIRRHDYAHHLWGVSNELPDALLLADPAAWVTHFALKETRKKAERDPALWSDLLSGKPPSGPFNRDHVNVYTREVLSHDVAAARAANAKAFMLCFALSVDRDDGTEQVRKMLLDDPEVRLALEPQSRENTQSTQLQRRLERLYQRHRRLVFELREMRRREVTQKKERP